MSNIKKNIALLTVLQMSNYIFPLITLPYLMRTLGTEGFGKIALSQAVIQYCILFTDYGFNLSATRRLAIAQNKNEFDSIFCSTFIAKMILVFVSFFTLVLLSFVFHNSYFSNNITLIMFSSVIGNLFFPLYLFQSLEIMGKIVWITILAKLFSLLSVFIFVHDKDNIYEAAISLSLGLFISGMISAIYIFKVKLINNFKIDFKEVRLSFSDGFPLFISNVAISFYTTFNVIFSGQHFDSRVVGNFSAAEKLRMALQSLYSPIQQVIFPRVNKEFVKHNSYKRIFKDYGLFFILFGFVLSLVSLFFGGKAALIYFGDDYTLGAELFKSMSPLFFIISVSIVLGQWGLIATGRSSYLSKIYIIGALLHLSYVYPLTQIFGIDGLVYSIIVTETLICVMMLIALNIRRCIAY